MAQYFPGRNTSPRYGQKRDPGPVGRRVDPRGPRGGLQPIGRMPAEPIAPRQVTPPVGSGRQPFRPQTPPMGRFIGDPRNGVFVNSAPFGNGGGRQAMSSGDGGMLGGRPRYGYGGGPEQAPPGYTETPPMGAFPGGEGGPIVQGPSGPIFGDPGPGMGSVGQNLGPIGQVAGDPNEIYTFWTPERMAQAGTLSMGAYDPFWNTYGGRPSPGFVGGGVGGGFNLSDLLG